MGRDLRILAQMLDAEGCDRPRLEATRGTVTNNQLRILRILSNRQHISACECAALLGLSNTAVSKNLDRLVAAGFVARRSHRGDRRRTDLAVLPAGRAVLDRFEECSEQRLHTLLARLSTEERMAFHDSVRRVIHHAITRSESVGPQCHDCESFCEEVAVMERCAGRCPLLVQQGE